jgi:hypothetical protein
MAWGFIVLPVHYQTRELIEINKSTNEAEIRTSLLSAIKEGEKFSHLRRLVANGNKAFSP